MRNPGLDLGSENPVAQEYYWDIKFDMYCIIKNGAVSMLSVLNFDVCVMVI